MLLLPLLKIFKHVNPTLCWSAQICYWSWMAKTVVLAAVFFTTLIMAVALLLSGCRRVASSSATGNTLFMHIFSDSDPQYLENLKFFVGYGVSQDYIYIYAFSTPGLRKITSAFEIYSAVTLQNAGEA